MISVKNHDKHKIIMKKLLSVLLAVLLVLGIAAPASVLAADEKEKIPIVYLRGNGNPIFDSAGQMAYPLPIDGKELTQQLVKKLMPYFRRAVFFGKWNEYYSAFEAEIREIFASVALDENGNISNDSGIANEQYRINERNMNTDKGQDGVYRLFDYNFWYDWRLDPWEIADELEIYIEHILAATGAEKVSLVGKCLGGGFVLAYLAKYGSGKIRSLAFDCTVGNGCEKLSDLFSGHAFIDTEAAERYYTEETVNFPEDVMAGFILASVALLNETDPAKLSQSTINMIYKKLYKQLTPRLCMASIGTWPGYWTNVIDSQYEEAKQLIFNGAVPEYAEKYKGLIEKLDNYDQKVRQRIPELLRSVKQSGTNVGVLAKYGCQLPAIIESRDMLSDSLVSLNRASFGATCSLVYNTLSDEYIAQQTEKGLGKYISPDRQVDASTCVFPDSTWIIKGMTHENWADCNDALIYTICTYNGQLTVDSTQEYPQFMVFDEQNCSLLKMTEENCDVTKWNAGEIRKHGIAEYFKALSEWLKAFIRFLKSLIKDGKTGFGLRAA